MEKIIQVWGGHEKNVEKKQPVTCIESAVLLKSKDGPCHLLEEDKILMVERY